MAESISKGIMQAGPGRTTLIGGSIVAASLGGLYLAMLHNKKKQEAAGTNPYFEQVMARANKKPEADEVLQPLRSYASNIPPALPGKDHHSGHSTRANWKATQDYANLGDEVLHMQPAPQRAATDGTDRPYTKSPDYVKNYGKTRRPQHVTVEI